MDVNIYVHVDSASVRPTEKWYGYVLETEVRGQIYTREGFDHIVGTYHQTVLEAVGKALERLKKECEVHVHTEDEFVLAMWDRNLETWAAGGFLTAKGKPVANQEEWIRVWELSKEHLIIPEPGKHTYSEWMESEIERLKEKQDV